MAATLMEPEAASCALIYHSAARTCLSARRRLDSGAAGRLLDIFEPASFFVGPPSALGASSGALSEKTILLTWLSALLQTRKRRREPNKRVHLIELRYLAALGARV